MLNIALSKPQKLTNCTESLFVSFQYDYAKVAKIKSLPIRHYQPDNKSWEVPVVDLDKVLALFSDEEITLTGKMSQNVSALKKLVISLEVNNFNFKTKPFDHQIEGLSYAVDHQSFLLGDEQGLGKTKQAIDIAIARKNQNHFKHCLIVCGVNSLKHNWMGEVNTHSNEKARIVGSKRNSKGHIVEGSMKERLEDLQRLNISEFFLILNIESLREPKRAKGDKKPYSKQEQLQLDILEELEIMCKDGTIGMVIIDEFHKCKNSESQQGKAIHYLDSKFKLPMTGTPLMNSPLDLHNVLKWIGVEKHSFYQFKKHFCIMGGFQNYEIVGYKNLDQLRNVVDANMLRRKKSEVLNLPPKIRSIEYVEMTAKQAQLYGEIKNAIQANLNDIVLSDNPLAELIRLRQVTGHTSILSQKIQESAKVDRLKEIIEELAENGQKAIIFSNWTSMTDILVKELKQYNPAVVTGETKDSQAEVVKFQNDPKCKLIIGTISKLGTGFTLTAASTVIFLDKPWNLANTEQAEDRAHRIGTVGTVNVVTLVCRDTIDERIEEIITEKGDLAEALVDGNFKKLNKRDLVERLLR